MFSSLISFAQYSSSYSYSTDSTSSAAGAGIAIGTILFVLVIMLVAYIFISVCLSKIFKKAGRSDAWAAWIPLYNYWVYLEVAGLSGWLAILTLISGVNLVIGIIAGIDMAKSFGKSTTFGWLALGLFPVIGYAMLAFGDAQYQGAAGSSGGGNPVATPMNPMQQNSGVPAQPVNQGQPFVGQAPVAAPQPPVASNDPYNTPPQPPVGPQPPVVQ